MEPPKSSSILDTRKPVRCVKFTKAIARDADIRDQNLSLVSMHMISKKDLSDAEMDTLTKSCNPTVVISDNGEVQTHEEATVYVKELDIFLTMKALENTSAVLSLGKLCDENGYSCEWINGQKTTSHSKLDSDTMQHRELRSDRGSWFVNKFVFWI